METVRRWVFWAVLVAMLGGCGPVNDTGRYERATHRIGPPIRGAVYLRDAEGRCLELETFVRVHGFQTMQSGNLNVHLVRPQMCEAAR